MSPLTRFMSAANAILAEQDAQRVAPSPHRPPIFVRTNYLFFEIDEALARAQALASQVKTARIENNAAKARELNKLLRQFAVQTAQMATFVEEQFQKDFGDAN